MSDLVVIVPSRGRPEAAVELAECFKKTCTANTGLVFAVDADDPAEAGYSMVTARGLASVIVSDSRSMVDALNRRAAGYAELEDELAPSAIGFMGDDHRPRTVGWDAAYLAALRRKPGLVYGNDLIQGRNLPTQVAMSAELVRGLGHMAPPTLTHLYVDNYWLQLGRASDRITYLPDVFVEHLHPVAGKAAWDEGYQRVNDQAMYDRDRVAFEEYWAAHGDRDVAVARGLTVDPFHEGGELPPGVAAVRNDSGQPEMILRTGD